MPDRKPSDSLKLKQRWKHGDTQTLDLSKSAHWNFINEQYARAGVTNKGEPKVFKALSAARKPGAATRTKTKSGDDALVPLNALTTVGFSADAVVASAFSAVPGGTIFTSLILELIDPGTDNVLATSSVSAFGEGEYMPIAVMAPRPPDLNEVEAIFTASYQTGSGRPVTQSVRLTVSDMADGNPDVREPVRRSGGHPDLRIGLGRRPRPDFDYWYFSRDPTHLDLRLPLVGTQRYQSPIAKPFEPVIAVYLIAPERGGVAMATTESVAALRKSLKVAGNKLSWNMPWSADPDRDRSLHFGGAAWGREPVLLVCTIDVVTKHANAPVRTVIASGATEAAGVGSIPEINYIWR